MGHKIPLPWTLFSNNQVTRRFYSIAIIFSTSLYQNNLLHTGVCVSNKLLSAWNRKVGQNGKIFLAILLHAAMQGNAVKRVLLSFSVPFLYIKKTDR